MFGGSNGKRSGDFLLIVTMVDVAQRGVSRRLLMTRIRTNSLNANLMS
jgi:hypothetical protein